MTQFADNGNITKIVGNNNGRVQNSVGFVVASIISLLFYVSLYGEVPHHDVRRFVAQIDSGQFVWDMGHIFLQPATLLWHQYLGFGETSEESQKHINSVATALAVGLFWIVLRRLAVPRVQSAFACGLLACSGSILILAPSGHMKLVAFPFAVAALYCLTDWELTVPAPRHPGRLAATGILLAIAGSFLASMLAIVPLACLAAASVTFRRQRKAAPALRDGAALGMAAALAFAVCVLLGWWLVNDMPFGLDGLRTSIAAKADLRPAATAPGLNVTTIARIIFGTIDNFTIAPAVGPSLRAALSGDATLEEIFTGNFAMQLTLVLLTGALIASIYAGIPSALMDGRRGIHAVVGFLLGAQLWTFYYGLNDPEHWFALAAPTILLCLLVFRSPRARWILPVWSVTTLVCNLTIHALPYRNYPLKAYEASVRAQFTSRDLLVYFVRYGGKPYLGFFELPGVPTLKLDAVLIDHGAAAGFGIAQRTIDDTLRQGGRVMVFDALDESDWNGAWAELNYQHIHKAAVLAFFRTHFTVAPVPPIAELPAWQLLPGG